VAVERRQKIENLSTEFRAKVGQSSPKSQISNPHISPKWRSIPPQTKIIFHRIASTIRSMGQLVGAGPKGGKPHKCPTPQFSTPHFFETPWSDFSQKLMGGDRISEVCKFVLWSRSDDRNWPNRLHSFGVFWGFGGKTPPASRELDPQFLWAPSCTTNGGKKFRPPETGSGRFLGGHPQLWGPLAPPLILGAGRW